MLLLILAHVDTGHHRLVVKEIFGKGLCKLGLSDTCRAEEYERTDRAARVVEAGTRTADCIGDGRDGVVLSDDTSVKLVFKMQELFFFTLHHLVDGNACPARHDIGDVFGIDFLLDEGFFALHHLELFLYCRIFLLFLLYF